MSGRPLQKCLRLTPQKLQEGGGNDGSMDLCVHFKKYSSNYVRESVTIDWKRVPGVKVTVDSHMTWKDLWKSDMGIVIRDSFFKDDVNGSKYGHLTKIEVTCCSFTIHVDTYSCSFIIHVDTYTHTHSYVYTHTSVYTHTLFTRCLPLYFSCQKTFMSYCSCNLRVSSF